MKFSEFKYSRPDVERLKEDITNITSRFSSADSYEEAKACFYEIEELYKHLSTMGTLVSIRHSINTADEFYDAEEKFFNSAMPELDEYKHKWIDALLSSRFRPELEKDFGRVFLLNAEIEKKTFSPEIIPELQKENDLVQEYEKLLSSSRIPFEGKEYTISQIQIYKTDKDDDRRLSAWKAEGQWYKDNQAELDRLYDELTALRTAMGRKLGYENYVQLGYYRMGRNCYTKDDVEKFRASVVKYLVPVAEKIFRNKAERFGKTYPMSFADNAIMFKSGDPRPLGDLKQRVENARRFFSELSPETGEMFNKMADDELLDLESKENKQGGGYCTEIIEYRVPFIFANFNGSSDDIETLIHEGGHAFAGWMNIDRVPTETIWPSMESCEVHSMSMEFFSHPWAELFFGEDKRKFLYSHLAGALTFIPYGTMVDHFQHIVYENPDLTPRQRHDEWKKLSAIYMPWAKMDGEIPFYSEGEGWQRQHHIYSYPFYYIDYCLAQSVALQFWAMIIESREKAFEKYLKYTKLGGSLTFTELLENAGLQNPFVEDALKTVCEKAAAYLDNYDLGGIE